MRTIESSEQDDETSSISSEEDLVPQRKMKCIVLEDSESEDEQITPGYQPLAVERVKIDLKTKTNVSSDLWIDQYVPETPEDICVHQLKKQHVENWIQNPISKCLILSGPSGIGKSTLIKVLSKALHAQLMEWVDPLSVYCPSRSNYEYHVPHVNQFDDFERFIVQCCRYPALQLVGASEKHSQIVFIQDWPLLRENSPSSFTRFHEILGKLMRESKFLVIIVYSNVTDGKATDGELSRVFSSSVVEQSEIIHCNPIPKGVMKKCIRRVAKQARQRVDSNVIDAIAESSGGDLRYALNTLQSGCQSGARDSFFSDIHVMGKLLYQKPIDLEYECSLDTDQLLLYLHHNSVSFYTEIDQLAEAMDLFSFADQIYDRHIRGTKRISQAMTERILPITNRSAAATRFRPITKPFYYTAERQKRQNLVHMQTSDGLSAHVACRDVYPYMDKMSKTGKVILDIVRYDLYDYPEAGSEPQPQIEPEFSDIEDEIEEC